MELSIRKKEFQGLLKTLHVIFSIVLVLSGIAMVLFLILAVAAAAIPEQSVARWVAEGSLSASMQINGIRILFEEAVVSRMDYDKGLMLALLVIAFLYVGLIFFISLLVKRFVKSSMSDAFFDIKNSKRIEWVAYCFVVMGLTLNSVKAFVMYTTSQLLQLDALIQQTSWIDRVSYHFFEIQWSILLCGLVIWTIGRIFRYGAFLQEEYDATV